MESDAIIQYLNRQFDGMKYEPIYGETIEKTILNTLIGTLRTTRLGMLPTENTCEEVIRRIRLKVQQNKPLELTSAWGAIKTIPTADRKIDLAELLAIEQFHAIANVVRTVYEPGVRFNIYLGDSFFSYLYGEDERMESYMVGMESIVEKYDEINTFRLGELSNHIECRMQQCADNYEVIAKYWFESAEVQQGTHDKLDSFKELNSIGWVGEITPAMREFYIKRMSSLYPNKPYEFWIEKIIHFFAYTLFISQNDLMGRKSADKCTVDVCLLRVPPPDLPRKLYSNRIRMRIAPQSIVKSSAPPWTVAGIVRLDEKEEPSVSLLNSAMYQNTKLEEVKYNGITIGVDCSELKG